MPYKTLYGSCGASMDYVRPVVESNVEVWLALMRILVGHFDSICLSINSTYAFAHQDGSLYDFT